MTREETKKIIMVITYTYPNYKPQDLSVAVDIWADMLSEYPYEQVSVALKTFIATDTSGFAPSIGQLIDCIHKNSPMTKEVLNANEAWALVTKAVRNSTYHAEEEFAKLPPIAQKAVGSAENLRNMASNSEFNEDVEKSLFTRIYDTAIKREFELAKLPQNIKAVIGQSGLVGIGQANG